MATVRDRALIGKHDEIGRAYVRLDPRRYGDFLTHEVWYDLEEKTGRILLRISMEGEKDEIGFYFGRAFRSLKRAETDMIRIFVDKVSPYSPSVSFETVGGKKRCELTLPSTRLYSSQMSPFIRHSLTRGVIKTLVKSTVAPVDYNETINKLTDRFRSAIGTSNEPLIPLPKEEKPAAVRPKALTDVDIEAAINPLLDYFDVNQATLSSSLSPTALHAVMGKIWKEILTVLEGLLVPPLSASPTDMQPLSDKEVDIVMKWREVSPSIISFEQDLDARLTSLSSLRFSSFATTSTPKGTRRDSRSRRFTTRSTMTSWLSVSTTTGRRESSVARSFLLDASLTFCLLLLPSAMPSWR